jgi:hypothetical protein
MRVCFLVEGEAPAEPPPDFCTIVGRFCETPMSAASSAVKVLLPERDRRFSEHDNPFSERVSSLPDPVAAALWAANRFPRAGQRLPRACQPIISSAKSTSERDSRLPGRVNPLPDRVISLRKVCRRLPGRVNRLPERANSHEGVQIASSSMQPASSDRFPNYKGRRIACRHPRSVPGTVPGAFRSVENSSRIPDTRVTIIR